MANKYQNGYTIHRGTKLRVNRSISAFAAKTTAPIRPAVKTNCQSVAETVPPFIFSLCPSFYPLFLYNCKDEQFSYASVHRQKTGQTDYSGVWLLIDFPLDFRIFPSKLAPIEIALGALRCYG